MNQPLRLYGHAISGHAHRVELFLSLLALPYERQEVDLLKREHKQPAFLAKNAFGQVPVLEDGELALADSNAILVYLALKYDPERRWLPADPVAAARVQRWLSAAAGPLAQGTGALRRVALLGGSIDREQAERISTQLLTVLEAELSPGPYLVGERATIADLSLYSYLAHAHVGGVSLEPYPAVRSWLARLEALPGFMPFVYPRSRDT